MRRVPTGPQTFPVRDVDALVRENPWLEGGEAALRKKWERDGKDPALQRRARLARERRVRGAGSGSPTRDEY